MGFTGKHWALVAAGAALFVLLLLAPRTVLNTRNAAVANRDAQPSANEKANTPADNLLAQLPALPTTTEGQVATRLAAQLTEAKDTKEKTELLGRLVAACVNVQRLDHAALYQEQLQSLAPSAEHLARTVALYRDAAELPPVLTDAALQKQFYALALRYATQYAQTGGTDAQAELAILQVKTGDQSTVMDGVRALRQLVEKNPAHLRAGMQLGIFSLQTGQYDKAEQRLRTVLAHHPNEALAHYYLAQSLRGQQKQTEATAALRTALRLTQDPALIDRIQAELKK